MQTYEKLHQLPNALFIPMVQERMKPFVDKGFLTSRNFFSGGHFLT